MLKNYPSPHQEVITKHSYVFSLGEILGEQLRSRDTISSSPMVVPTVLCQFRPIKICSSGEQEGWLSLFLNSHIAFQSLTLIKRSEILSIFCLNFLKLDADDPLRAFWRGNGNNESPQPCVETMSLYHLQGQAVDQVFLVCSCIVH